MTRRNAKRPLSRGDTILEATQNSLQWTRERCEFLETRQHELEDALDLEAAMLRAEREINAKLRAKLAKVAQ